MYGTFLFDLVSPFVLIVAKTVAIAILFSLGVGLCVGALLTQVYAPFFVLLNVYTVTRSCCVGQHWAEVWTCRVLSGVAALGLALGVYFVTDICFAQATVLGLHLVKTAFELMIT